MDAYTTDEPIYALATPYAPSAIAVVRTSGDNAIEMISRAFSGAKRLLSAQNATLVHGRLRDASGSDVDEVVLAVYRKGHGYTGEEAVEINAHGSLRGLDRIFRLLEELGFRKAKKGEFTYRAFMHGRLDLTQAEAVEELISAKSESVQAAALDRLEGSLKKKLQDIRKRLLMMSASLEVQLDYAEDEILEDWVMPTEELDAIISELSRIRATYDASALWREGAKVVLAGETNAGKSSLFNLLTKEERAIVSPVRGTTRDYLEADTMIHGIPVRLYDTAGLRESDDEIEMEGIRRSERLIREADLVLYLVAPGDSEEVSWDTPTITVRTKSDLSRGEGLSVSVKSGEGLDELLDEIKLRLTEGRGDFSSSVIIDSERQKDALDRLLSQLEFLVSHGDESYDIIALFFQSALSVLGEITGEVTSEELLDTLFSNFCLGK
ncbi:MAG: tRNA uridine-5-carboxymethylaminomethyl(34) synthesis GTPase MnmE [Bullifex sp.]|nr:tRNA uridine-5-carboxymethylaminomethyl(34) synthesis GTPase MnmE [Spirochaetales bacterium]MDY2815509.1 tRNA uridine-5-carboxymethylaminomethyl(34) synthesis GTPase MnmE [Bullifex sp.]